MATNRRFLIGGAALTVLVTAISITVISLSTKTSFNNEAYADYPVYNTFDETVDAADTIIQGEIVGTKETKILDVGISAKYDVYKVEVTQSVKGELTVGDTIEVKVIVSAEKIHSTLEYKDGNDYVFFLKTYGDAPASLINIEQGSLKIVSNGHIVADPRNKVFEESKVSSEFGKSKDAINKDDIIQKVENLDSSQ